MDKTAPSTPVLESNIPINLCKKRVIVGTAHVQPWFNRCSSLTNNYRPTANKLTVKTLNAQPL